VSAKVCNTSEQAYGKGFTSAIDQAVKLFERAEQLGASQNALDEAADWMEKALPFFVKKKKRGRLKDRMLVECSIDLVPFLAAVRKKIKSCTGCP